MKNALFGMLAAVAITIHCLSAGAAVIVQYDMADLAQVGNSSSTTANIVLSGVTASALTDDDGNSPHPGDFAANNAAQEGWNTFSARSVPENFDGGWEFTITPPSVGLTFDSLSLDAHARMTLAGGTAHFDYNVRWSVDNFATVLGTINGPSADTTENEKTETGLSIDLSNLPAQTNTFTFRIEPVNLGGTNGVFTQRGGAIDNLTLNGNIVPEPASIALLGIGGFLLIRPRR